MWDLEMHQMNDLHTILRIFFSWLTNVGTFFTTQQQQF